LKQEIITLVDSGTHCPSLMQAFCSLVSDIAKILDKEGPTERSTGTLRLGESNSYSQAHQKSHCPCA